MSFFPVLFIIEVWEICTVLKIAEALIKLSRLQKMMQIKRIFADFSLFISSFSVIKHKDTKVTKNTKKSSDV